ncbi:hypothetical protein LOTGIDRAFT_161660 [Lottia gigantea]|uniref:TRPM SLOG domain-containing protein n=1 Tax=Lottia gigantea TaxID=225164 RepID=V4BWY1_LOTGI|nr:hypothetical protein LOTGIDRAFT_161660 [Lottia gigantea]ESO93554.1 hypothetical protein LOTGIDRAFT_161660 [Lottia gigantea]
MAASGNTIEMAKVKPVSSNRNSKAVSENASDKNITPTLAKSQQDEKKWIKTNIKVKECAHFVKANNQESSQDPKCNCGLRKGHHRDNQKQGHETHWKAHSIHANAYGELEFDDDNNQVAKFVRVGDCEEGEVKRILDNLLIKHWNLQKPNLLISVTGGAKNFDMKARLKEVFRRGLQKAAESTGAWIITGGSNAGVMKYVGEAIKEISISDEKNRVVAIGVAPWGCVKKRDELINSEGVWPYKYSLNDGMKSDNPNETLLDPNHTHFLLVDNGTQNKWGTEIAFRSKLEKVIAKLKSTMKTDDTGTETKDIPVVLLVLQGGPGTYQTIHGAIKNKTPTVVIKGTGGAADIIAQAFQKAKPTEVSKIDQSGIEIKETIMELDDTAEGDLILKLQQSYDKNSIQDYMNKIREIIHNKDLLTVFELDSRNLTVDVAILTALLKANKNDVMDQLELALVWDKMEVAKNDILGDDTLDRKKLNLPEKMLTAIERNRVSFVDLFIDYGVNLKQFLTKEKLLQLYNTEKITMAHVGELLQYLIGDYYLPYYCDKNNSTYNDVNSPVHSGLQAMTNLHVRICSEDNYASLKIKVDHPIQDLFVWSVLMNRQEMADLFWKELDEPLAAALFANSLYKAMNTRSEDTEISLKLHQHAEEFNDKAIGVLNSCYEKDEVKTQEILVRQLRNWGQTTCVIMAVQADNKRFISQTACQTLLNSIWMGNLSQDNSIFSVIPSIVLFPLILTPIVKFKDDEIAKVIPVGDKDKEGNSSDGEKIEQTEPPNRQSSSNSFIIDPIEETGNSRLSCCERFWYRLKTFYLAPAVIFYLNVLTYLVFLGLYSFHLLISFNRTFTILEGVLCGWVVTIFVEEIRQMSSKTGRVIVKSSRTKVITSNATSVGSKFRTYFTDYWNILDLMTIFLFAFGIILRFIPNDTTFEIARVSLCLNLISFYFRILHIFSVNKQLGPKLVMIRRMVQDLMSFVVILAVFIIAYAVATEAILYPNTEFSWKLFYHVPRKAYWQIYGELFLEDIEGQNDCTNDAALYRDYNQPRCPSEVGKFVAPVLMGFYVLMTNVLLLNLLIAMFSYTFELLHQNTDSIWRFANLQVVMEYSTRPPLPPPFTLILHVKYLVHHLTSCHQCPPGTSHGFRKVYDKNGQYERQLIQWESVIAEAYCNKAEQASMESINQRYTTVLESPLSNINHVMEYDMRESVTLRLERFNDFESINQRYTTVLDRLENVSSGRMMEYQDAQGQDAIPTLIETRFEGIEEQIKISHNVLDWIMKSLIEHKLASKDERPELADVEERLQKEERKKAKKRIRNEQLKFFFKQGFEVHVKCRNSTYPETNIMRAEVKDDEVCWAIKMKKYNPVRYTAPKILSNQKTYTDKYDLIDMPENERDKYDFNKFDMVTKVDRTSLCGFPYEISHGLPLNPRGRTGLVGRGLLGRWGPNHAADTVVSRWKKDGDLQEYREKKPCLEFVAVQRPDKQWAIPGGFGNPDKKLEEILMTVFAREALGTLMDDPKERPLLLQKLKKLSEKGRVIYEGYADDERNTDNSWSESRLILYHDDTGEILDNIKLRAGDTVCATAWITASSTMTFWGAHEEFLRMVTDDLKAHFNNNSG